MESPFHKTTRLGLESRIKEHLANGDAHVVNELLDVYPTGRSRPEISLELARHTIDTYQRPDAYATVEIPAVEAA